MKSTPSACATPISSSVVDSTGVVDDDMLHAYRNPIRVFDLDDLTTLIGPDQIRALARITGPATQVTLRTRQRTPVDRKDGSIGSIRSRILWCFCTTEARVSVVMSSKTSDGLAYQSVRPRWIVIWAPCSTARSPASCEPPSHLGPPGGMRARRRSTRRRSRLRPVRSELLRGPVRQSATTLGKPPRPVALRASKRSLDPLTRSSRS